MHSIEGDSSWCYRPTGYLTFPVHIRVGTRVKSVEDLQDLLATEARGLKLKSTDIYSVSYIPSKKNWSTVRLVCLGRCRSTINAHKQGMGLVVSSVKPIHELPAGNGHHQQVRKKYTLDNYFKRVDDDNSRDFRISTVTKNSTGEAELSAQKQQRKHSEPMQQPRNAKESKNMQLKRWLQQEKYQSTMTWDERDEKRNVILVASPEMQENYASFGDLLGITVFDNLLVSEPRTHPKIGIFSVLDDNERVLIAAVAIFVELPGIFQEIFEEFLKINKQKPPNCLVSQDIPALSEAIADLKTRGVLQGSNVLSPWSVLKQYWGTLQGQPANKAQILHQIKEATTTRSRSRFHELISALCANNSSRQLTKSLLTKYPSVFYAKRKHSFFGLGADQCRAVHTMIRKHFPKRLELLQFIKEISKLEKSLNQISASFQEYEDEIEQEFGDRWLQYIRQHFQKRVVERFLENYFSGISYCYVVEERMEQYQPTFLIACRSDNSKYLIRNGFCECEEMEKTGVACPHLIMLATVIGRPLYSELISNRWKNLRVVEQLVPQVEIIDIQ